MQPKGQPSPWPGHELQPRPQHVHPQSHMVQVEIRPGVLHAVRMNGVRQRPADAAVAACGPSQTPSHIDHGRPARADAAWALPSGQVSAAEAGETALRAALHARAAVHATEQTVLTRALCQAMGRRVPELGCRDSFTLPQLLAMWRDLGVQAGVEAAEALFRRYASTGGQRVAALVGQALLGHCMAVVLLYVPVVRSSGLVLENLGTVV
jgi:hypothetical protein